MKKLLYMASVLALAFTSCDPMEDVYEELDAAKKPYKQEIEVNLSADDYGTISKLALEVAKTEQEEKDAKSIGSYKSFSKYVSAADYIPMFIADQYPTLEEGSSADVTYDYYQGSLSYLYDFINHIEALEAIDTYELSTADYDSMGEESGEPGKYNNFSSSTPPADYLPAFLLAKYPDAEADYEVLVTFKYYSDGVSDVSEFWAFDGTVWTKSDKVAPSAPDGVEIYELTSDDYDSMGENSGEPGKYNKFSSSIKAEKYLGTFLLLNKPYAEIGDKIATFYKYEEKNDNDEYVTSTKAKEFTFEGSVWSEYSSTINITEQYVMSNKGWIFDPTIIQEMLSSDYQIIVDYVKSNIDADIVDSYGTGEKYYGFNSYYGNVDIREGNRDASFENWQDAVKDAMLKAYLPNKYPDATTTISGVDSYYMITVKTYDGNSILHTLKFQCTKSGPNPEFTYIEGLPE